MIDQSLQCRDSSGVSRALGITSKETETGGRRALLELLPEVTKSSSDREVRRM